MPETQPIVIDKNGDQWTTEDGELWALVTSGPDHDGGIEWDELAERFGLLRT